MAETVQAEDVLPVRSRISWGPIFGGATIALAFYFLLALLGGAIGLSIRDNVRADNIATGAIVWAIVTMVICLFVGGLVTSQLSVGENKIEGVLYGIIMWAGVFATLLCLTASGVRGSFNAMIGVASVGSTAARDMTPEDWESAAVRAGFPRDRIEEWRKSVANAPDTARRTVENPENQEAAAAAATKVMWWAFAGAWLSMLAAAGGAFLGAGPTFYLIPAVRTLFHQPTIERTRHDGREPIARR